MNREDRIIAFEGLKSSRRNAGKARNAVERKFWNEAAEYWHRQLIEYMNSVA
jgi:hypothetical protein